VNTEEIRFWSQQVEQGTLIQAIRADPRRAITFFGKASVLSEDEEELYRTLNAHEIINSPDKELLDHMNRVPDSMIDKLEKFPPEERAEIEQLCRFTAAKVLAMKKHAQEHLNKLM
jgi:hypothetical protein